MIVIFDSNYVGYNSAFAFSKGLEYLGGRTEVIYGFLLRIIDMANKFEPDQMVFCWDPRGNKRKEIFPGYKDREPTDIQIKESRNVIHEQFREMRTVVLPYLGFSNIFMIEGFESDDVIAKIVHGRDPQETIVISSDDDLLQLLDHCCVYSISKRRVMNKKLFQKEYRITPSEWPMVKAIAGCRSDTVPGVFGVAKTTAIKYLKGELKGAKKEAIDNAKKLIERNLGLVKLPLTGCPNPRITKNDLSMKKFQEVASHYGMNSILSADNTKKWSDMVSKIE